MGSHPPREVVWRKFAKTALPRWCAGIQPVQLQQRPAMNHLVGTSLDNAAISSLIEPDEQVHLATFKAMYMAHPDADCTAEPRWQVAADSLPESGWRPLDDITLLRFLRADKRKGVFSCKTSMDRLLKALEWRRQMRSDALLATPSSEQYEALRIRRWVGTDLQFRPVLFERLGSFLGSSNAKAFSAELWLANYARDLETHFEQMRAAAVAHKHPTVTYLYCADFAGGSSVVWHMGSVVPLLKVLTKEVESHFPVRASLDPRPLA